MKCELLVKVVSQARCFLMWICIMKVKMKFKKLKINSELFTDWDQIS